MRRSVGRLASDRRLGMIGRPLALVWLSSLGAGAGEVDPPDLAAPNEMPAVAKPPAPPTPRPLVSTPRSRAVLAIPGLTSPAARPPAPASTVTPLPDPLPGEVSLDGPIEMNRPLESLPTRPASSPARPFVLESSPLDEPSPIEEDGAKPKKPSTTTRPAPQPLPSQARRSRFFGLLPGPAPAGSRSTPPGRSVAEGLPTDTVAEAALKRRVERQAREVVGGRARSVEVKVVGKDVVVQVVGAKMFQKRALRKPLEGIPALSGLRSTIEFVD